MPGKKFTQREAAKYLARCQNETEVEEVLSCYLYSKASRGHQSPMLARKLQLLGLYCCAIDLAHVYRDYQPTWQMLYREVVLHDGGLIGAKETTSPIALEVWNDVRRCEKRKSILRSASSSSSSSSASSSTLSLAARADAERSPRLLGLFRSRSSSVHASAGSASATSGSANDTTTAVILLPVREGAAAQDEDHIGPEWGNRGPGALLQVARWSELALEGMRRSSRSANAHQPRREAPVYSPSEEIDPPGYS